MMGSALCIPMADRGHDIRLVGTHLDADIIASLRRDGVHPKLGLPLPKAVSPYPVAELEQAMEGCELLALGVSSAGTGWRLSLPELASLCFPCTPRL